MFLDLIFPDSLFFGENLYASIIRMQNQAIVTTYSAVEAETDSSPCEGAFGNVCNFNGQAIALSRDLIKARTPFDESNGYCKKNCFAEYGDIIETKGYNCNYTGTVLDTMNKRFRNRVDILVPLGVMNKCNATIKNLSK